MKNKYLQRSISISLTMILTMLILLVVGCGTTQTSDPAKLKVKVGIIDTYTGGPSAYTKDALDGFKLAVEEVAKEGGPTIEFETRDDQYKPEQAMIWAKELVMKDNVDVLVGSINSAVSLALSQYAKDSKIPFLNYGALSENITGAQGHRYVFGFPPNSAMIAKTGAVQISKTNYTKFWLAGSDYDYGRTVVGSLWTNMQKLKPSSEKVGESWWKVGETDFTPYVTAIRAAKPDVIIVGAGASDIIPFMKTLKATGLAKDIPVWIPQAIDANTLVALGTNTPEGVLGTGQYFPYFPDAPANKVFVEAFKKATTREPGYAALYGYLTGKYLGAAVKKAGSIDKEKIIDALEGLSLDTPIGKNTTMRKEDHQLMDPMFYGSTPKVLQASDITVKDLVLVGSDQIMPSIEDILAKRTKK